MIISLLVSAGNRQFSEQTCDSWKCKYYYWHHSD